MRLPDTVGPKPRKVMNVTRDAADKEAVENGSDRLERVHHLWPGLFSSAAVLRGACRGRAFSLASQEGPFARKGSLVLRGRRQANRALGNRQGLRGQER